MAMKTMLRQLISKWGIMSIDLQTALDKDMAVIHEDGTADYVENEEVSEDVVEEQEYREAAPAASPEVQPPADGQMSMEEAFFKQ